jgi:hypothetical protein
MREQTLNHQPAKQTTTTTPTIKYTTPPKKHSTPTTATNPTLKPHLLLLDATNHTSLKHHTQK